MEEMLSMVYLELDHMGSLTVVEHMLEVQLSILPVMVIVDYLDVSFLRSVLR